MSESKVIESEDLDHDIDMYMMQGYRMDMIMPADAPREAILSVPSAVADGSSSERTIRLRLANGNVQPPATAGGTDSAASGSEWTAGRAGMMYRDLIPDRLAGKVIASHIRIVNGGEVADRVHYHKIDFQIIYCLKGAIRVVYEDQGEPFWLRSRDCVLQPPEIRHRVLEAEAESEVIEITSPAEHETWFDHAMELPTNGVDPDRLFGTQRFGRHIDGDSVWKPSNFDGILASDTKIPGVRTLKHVSGTRNLVNIHENQAISLLIMVDGRGITAVNP